MVFRLVSNCEKLLKLISCRLPPVWQMPDETKWYSKKKFLVFNNRKEIDKDQVLESKYLIFNIIPRKPSQIPKHKAYNDILNKTKIYLNWPIIMNLRNSWDCTKATTASSESPA